MQISKDLVSGLIFLAIGAFMVVVARDYQIGVLLRMGPGYFPTVIGTLIFAAGLYFTVKGLLQKGERVPQLALRPLFFLLAAILVFAFMLERFGLVIATALLILIGRMASPKPLGWVATAVLAAVLITLGATIFRISLGLPLRLWPI